MAKKGGMGQGRDLSGEAVFDEQSRLDDLSTFGAHSSVGPFCDIVESHCGRYTFLAENIRMVYTTMGSFCSVAKNARINAEQHPFFERVTTHNFTYFGGCMYHRGEDDLEYLQRRRERTLSVGNDVWVGHGAVIMGDLTIGDGAVIGANAVVTHDVAPYQIVGGVPARPLGYRFTPDIIAALERIRWWEWDDETLWARKDDMKDVPTFCAKYDRK